MTAYNVATSYKIKSYLQKAHQVGLGYNFTVENFT